MKIKSTTRVIYRHNPLAEVICQVRFDRILELQDSSPHSFQGLVERTFPHLTVEHSASIQVVTSQRNSLTDYEKNPASAPTIYRFASENGDKKVSICADFFSFACTRYSRWEDFKVEFSTLFEKFSSFYPKTALKRIGLRYKDLVLREPLGLEDTPWGELISPAVAGIFATGSFFDPSLNVTDERMLQQGQQAVIMLDECDILLQSAVLTNTDSPPKRAFLIDSDFYHESERHIVTRSSLMESIEILHTNAGALFRACITDKLHDALGPQPV